MATEVLQSTPERLKAAGSAVADAKDALQLKLQLRDRLVRRAVDEGMSVRQVAAAAGITSGRVSHIMATPEDEDGDE